MLWTLSIPLRCRTYDLPNVKKVVASGPGCDDNTMVGRGVDIAILGVDIAILRTQEKVWGLQGREERGG